MFRELRRREKAMPREEAEELLKNGSYGVLSTCGDDGYAYGVPLNFVYDGRSIYFHCATEGHKLDNLRRNPKISFCVVGEQQVIPQKLTTHFESVVVFGTAKEVSGGEKGEALRLLVEKYAPASAAPGRKGCSDAETAGTDVVKISVEHLCGKASR